jgi:puromycin-sensitive aminopeptidase
VTQVATTTSELDPYRLPRHTLPSRYELVLEPDLAAASFNGIVDIAVTTTGAPVELVLNAIELDIVTVTVDGVDAGFRLDESTERLFVTPGSPLADGGHRLHIEFRGVLNDKLRGWYRSVYTDADGNAHTIATTQMQSTDARRASRGGRSRAGTSRTSRRSSPSPSSSSPI